jgi:DNA-binding CsgD family transcriptional regulator
MSLTGVAHSLAVLAGAVGLGIGMFLYSINRTLLLRHFLAFLTSVFLFVLSFFLRETGVPDQTTAGTLAFIAEAVGGILQVVILPSLVYGLFVQPVPAPARVVGVVSALVMGGLVIAAALAPEIEAIKLVIAALLYGSIGAYIARMIIWLARRRRQGEEPERAGVERSIRGFVFLSAVFLPLFVLDMLFSLLEFPAVLQSIDNLSVPLYFTALSIGAIRFARRYLNQPALIQDEEVTEHGRAVFGLTPREAEVVEYIMEGYSVPDAAKALKIGAKTVENHLYNVYQKTGVSNRIQLFQLFQNRRRV